jgi:hypothetical protein
MKIYNPDLPINAFTTPPDNFNRVHAFLGLTKKEWLAAQLFISEYNRELYNRDLESIIIKECKQTAANFFNDDTINLE